MKISFYQIDQILKKIPIGYYIGRNIKTSLSNEESSYYNFMSDEIVISYPQIMKAIKNIKVRSVKNNKVEMIVRTLIYHEVSHAMLTPRSLKNSAIVNIIEDERIERKMDGYFLNTDFVSLKNILIGSIKSNNTLSSFQRFVRLGDASKEWIDRLESLLYNYRNIDTSIDATSDWRNDKGIPWEVRNYCSECHRLYEDWCDARHNQEQIPPTDCDNAEEDDSPNIELVDGDNGEDGNGHQGQSSTSDQNNDSNTFGETDNSQNNSQNCDGSEVGSEESNDSETVVVSIDEIIGKGRSNGNGKDICPDLCDNLNHLSEFMVDQDLINELDMIFRSHSKVTKSNSSAISAYSGVFDPRLVARDDYKYFVQRNRFGGQKAYSKIHINLFLDRSGSFDSTLQANQIIYALNRIERISDDFDYTLISCGDGEDIEDHDNYIHNNWDGTRISENMSKIYKKVQKRGALNYNIVLYDGLATTRNECDRWSTFNNPETMIISDPSNENYIKNYAPSARTKIIRNGEYADSLKKELIKLLSLVIR